MTLSHHTRPARTGCGILASILAFSCASGDAAESAGSNVLFLCVDTLRADHMGQAGYARDTTPRLDALAASGTRFERCYSTYPQTAASVASIFTSLYPSGHKVSRDAMVLSRVPALLAESFRTAGYRTAAVATNPHLSPGLGFERGFERFVYIHGKNVAKSTYEGGGVPEGVEVLVRGSSGTYYGRGDHVNRAALEWLDETEAGGGEEAPFYLYLHYMDVHSPYVSPRGFQQLFSGGPPRKDGRGRNIYRNGIPTGEVHARDVEFTEAVYDGGIRYLDQNIGALLDALEKRALLDNTLILFTSDHGEEFMEHGGLGHGETLYRELLHVPLFFAGPGVPVGATDTVVSTIDIFPTLCELAGIPLPAGLQGTSLVALTRDGEADGPRSAYALAECLVTRTHTGGEVPRISLMGDSLHLIHEPGTGHSELFDARADPDEEANLAEERSSEVSELVRAADALRNRALELGAAVRAESVELEEATLQELDALGYGGE